MTHNSVRDVPNSPVRCRMSPIDDDHDRLMSLPEFWRALSERDINILQHVAAQHLRAGLPSADVLAAGLIRVEKECGDDYMRYPQWMQVHVRLLSTEGARLAGEVRRDRIRLRGFDITTQAGDSAKLDFPSPSASPLDLRLDDQSEALLKHVIRTMRQVVDDLVAAGKIPSHRANGCKAVFAAYIDDPTESLRYYGEALAPEIPRNRLYEYWALTCIELINRLGGGGEFLAQLGRPKGPRPAGLAGTPCLLPRKGALKPKC